MFSLFFSLSNFYFVTIPPISSLTQQQQHFPLTHSAAAATLPPPPSAPPSHHPPPPPSIHVYKLFFRIEKNHPGIVFLLETMQVGIKFTISFLKKTKKTSLYIEPVTSLDKLTVTFY
jgi:hypothetical protein